MPEQIIITTIKRYKPALLAWLLLSVIIISAQLFNYPYQYAIAVFVIALFNIELYLLTRGEIIERNGFITHFTTWSYLWRTVTMLFVSTVFIVTLAMIFFPDDFIYHRLTTLVIIVFCNMSLLFLVYKTPKNHYS